MEKPQPFLAGFVWIACFVAFVALDGRAILTASGDVLAYALIGAAFGLSAHHVGRLLVGRAPTESQVAEGMSLRRFRLKATGVDLLIIAALGFAVWRLGADDPGFGNDAPMMSFITFWTIQWGMGWSSSRLVTKPVPDRPDARV